MPSLYVYEFETHALNHEAILPLKGFRYIIAEQSRGPADSLSRALSFRTHVTLRTTSVQELYSYSMFHKGSRRQKPSEVTEAKDKVR